MVDHNSVLFHPSAPHTPFNNPVMSNRSTALDVCYSVYGENSVAGEFIDSYYDANAGMIGIEIVFITLTDCQSSVSKSS